MDTLLSKKSARGAGQSEVVRPLSEKDTTDVSSRFLWGISSATTSVLPLYVCCFAVTADNNGQVPVELFTTYYRAFMDRPFFADDYPSCLM